MNRVKGENKMKKIMMILILCAIVGCNGENSEGRSESSVAVETSVALDFNNIDIADVEGIISECVDGVNYELIKDPSFPNFTGYDFTVFKNIYPEGDNACESDLTRVGFEYLEEPVPMSGADNIEETGLKMAIDVLSVDELGPTGEGRLFSLSVTDVVFAYALGPDGEQPYEATMLLTQDIDEETGVYSGNPYILIEIDDMEIKLVLTEVNE